MRPETWRRRVRVGLGDVVGDAGSAGEVSGVDVAAEEGEDVAGLSLFLHPAFVGLCRDGGEAGVETETMGAEEQLFEDGIGGGVGDFHEHAEGEGVVDDRLADVEDNHAVAGQHFGEGDGQTGAVRSGNIDLHQFRHGRVLAVPGLRGKAAGEMNGIFTKNASLFPEKTR